MSVNKDDVQIPWITKEFLEDVLHGEDSPDVSVIGRDIEMAVAKGDNYMSILYRVHVQCKKPGSDEVHSRHLIIKILPAGDYMQELIKMIGIFKRELKAYNVILPALYRLQESSGPAPLTPRSFYTSRPDTLVLEDLRSQGFVMSERRNRLDLPHCRLVVRSLARLHGLSAVLFHREPALLADFGTLYTNINRERMCEFLMPQLKTIANVVETWPGYERFGPKIKNLMPNAMEGFYKITEQIGDGFHIFNHGDCWINNVLFKYSSGGELVDMRFVDFQLSRISSPALDLQYFLYASPQDEVRDHHWDNLLVEYHEALCATVRELDPDVRVFNLLQLQEEMKRTTLYGFMMAIPSMSTVVGKPSDTFETADYQQRPDSINVFEKTQMSPEFVKPFQKLLIKFEKTDIFD